MKIELPRPHSGQFEVYRSDARYRVLACGRRWGKTVLMQVLAAQKVVRDGQPVGWFAPNYKYLTEPFRELKRRLGPLVVASNHERFLEIQSEHGRNRIDFWTLEDVDSGRGYKYGRVIIDEAGMVPKLGESWENAIRATLTDFSGDALFGGTPKGRNFFHEIYQRADEEKPGWASFQKPTSTNPHLPPAEYDQDRLLSEGLPERSYRQEYLAEFIDDAGGVFIGVSDCVDHGRKENEPPKPGRKYFAGLDLAQAHDYTVLVIFDDEGRQVYIDRFNKLSWSLTVSRVAEAIKRYGAITMVDATGVGQPIFESLRSEGCDVRPFKFTSLSKPPLIEHAVAVVQRQDIRLMDNRVQNDEIKAYEYEVTKSGNVRMNAPEGMHDDCVIAVCLAVHALRRPSLAVFV